jgi:DNA-directed RNA polymerase subunit M/transcription elongation factor TFIIS
MPRKGSNKEESVQETEKTEENIEQTEEIPEVQEEIVEKIVEKPLDLADKSPEELAELEANIKSQGIKNHLKAESQRIKDISCPKCGKNLGLKPEDYLKLGNLPESIECKECGILVRVYVNYQEDPSISTADILVKNAGYVWINQLPSTWEDKHALKWVEQEVKKLMNNQSSLSPDNQKMLRVQMVTLKKQRLIK